MKLAYVAAALALSDTSFATAMTNPNDDTCSSAQQTQAYVSLAGVLSSSDLGNCITSMGLNLLYATVLPTDTQYETMCQLTSCHALVQTVIGLNPPDCSFVIPTSGLYANVYELAHAFAGKCETILNPVTEPPATEGPVTENPDTEEPIIEDPVTEDPATDDPTTEDPVTEDPVTEEPDMEEPVTEDPVTEEPVTEEPKTEEPVTNAPTTDVPVVTTASPTVCDW